MKYRVEHCLECHKGWVVLNPLGLVVFETNSWECAIEDALARYRDSLIRLVLTR